MTYPNVEPQPRFPELEQRVLGSGRRTATLEASVERATSGRDGANEYVFYDGPPFANGLPHYGHLVTGYVKDIVPRYQTMRGRRVERRFGWDCHGLPAELEAEQQLGISGRREILDYGVARFNETAAPPCCAPRRSGSITSTARRAGSTSRTTTGPWISPTWRASCGRSRRCGTRASSTKATGCCPTVGGADAAVEHRDAARQRLPRRQDPALTVAFELGCRRRRARRAAGLDDHAWTLPSNLALAVGDDIEYAVFEQDGERWILADSLREDYAKELEGAERSARSGRELSAGATRRCSRSSPTRRTPSGVLGGDFVTAERHRRRAHGARLRRGRPRLCRPRASRSSCPVDDEGRFTDEVAPGPPGLRREPRGDPRPQGARPTRPPRQHDHNYPHCWRRARPLVHPAMSSWFVQVTAFRDAWWS